MAQSVETCVLEQATINRRSAILRAFDALLRWQERAAERRRLSGMEDYILRDIGLSRADIDQEVRKPFWQG